MGELRMRSETWQRVALYAGVYVVVIAALLWLVAIPLRTTLTGLLANLWIAVLVGLGVVVVAAFRDARAR